MNNYAFNLNNTDVAVDGIHGIDIPFFQCDHPDTSEVFMRKKTLFALVFTILFLLLTPGIFAYQLSPLNVTYDPSGANSQKVYTIVNDSDSPIAIELKAVKRNIDIDGNESNDDASAYFLIQPSKMIIKPQSTQLVRVVYRGPRTVTKELNFRIISEQIPYSVGVQQPESGQMISFLFVYSTSAYVKPSRIVEKVGAAAVENADGCLEITFENNGSVHQLLNNLSVTVNGDKGSYTLTDDDMGGIKGNNLLTDSKLRIVMEMPEILDGSSSYKVDFSYDFSYSA